MQPLIHFFEKPVTRDEQEIATLLEKIVQAIAAKDIDLLVSVYSDSASIEMLMSKGMSLSKSGYRARMSKIIGNVRNIYFRDAIIRVNGQEAFISCLSGILFRGKVSPLKNQRYFKCIKEGGQWRIVEARYI